MIELVEITSAIFAVIASGIGILYSLGSGAAILIRRYREWKIRRAIKGLILKPTTEELAKYSAKLPQPNMTDAERHSAISRRAVEGMLKERESRLRQEGRMMVLMFFFSACFFMLSVFYLVEIL